MIRSKEISDVIEWDVVNWGKFLKFIEKQNIEISDKHILELGARRGGLSLYFANRGGALHLL